MSITLGQLSSNVTAAADKVDPVSAKKLSLLAQVGVGYVKDEIQNVHAVDTGTMLNSTQADQLDATTWAIGPTVLYAPYVALGTSRMEARPFHIYAANRLNRDLKDFLTGEDLGL